MRSTEFAWAAWGIPLVAVAGSWTAGIVSDRLFAGRRAPVAAALYFVESLIILAAAYYASTVGLATMFLIMISFTANSTHSILGTAAAMDIGGRRLAGTAAGLIDSFQYYGGGLAGIVLGSIIQRFGWQAWFFSMCGFGFIGCLLMLSIFRVTSFRDE
jgi:OPA family glycerol-3-phosphate transporter-like MFS transporter